MAISNNLLMILPNNVFNHVLNKLLSLKQFFLVLKNLIGEVVYTTQKSRFFALVRFLIAWKMVARSKHQYTNALTSDSRHLHHF